ncbi:putative trichothecene 15-O-acetyltransferase, partial [Aureobasidium melanogenum]
MAIIESKKVEPAKYRWHKVGDTANSVQRRGNGTENWVGLRKENARGQYDCYILVKATLQHSLSLASLKQKLVYGLLKERFEHPNVACKAYWDEQFGPLIRDVPDTDTIISQGSPVEFLVHFNHIYWDGISARLFVGHLLNSVGQDLEHAQYNWGKEVENLSAPLLDSLKIDPQTLGEDYEDSLEEFVSTMFEFGSSHAMPIGTNPGLPETAILQLPPSLCQKIIQAVKSRLGPGYTITHLGQAATLLTLLKLSPLPKEALTNKSVIMPLPVNGRRYLREEVANMQYGSCQACAVVVFDNLAQYAIDFGDRDAVVEALIEAMKVTKTAYDYWLNKPYLLPLGLAKDNFFSALMESNESIPDGKAVPIIASDGLNDLYIPSTVLTQDGSPILDVDDVIFLTDTYEPGILLRMEGWNGTTSLSLSYSDGSFSSEEAKAFLQCMEEFMMSFVT